MPTRTLKLRLVVPRDSSSESVQLRRALWATHRFVNEAVAFYENLLLEMRQGDVLVPGDDEETVVPAVEWARRLRARLTANGVEPATIEESLAKFKHLYGEIVKSVVAPGRGSAQDARSFHSALVDPASQAGEAQRKRLEVLRPLLGIADDGKFHAAAEKIIADHGEELIKATGSPPGWVRRFKAGDPTWPQLLKSYLSKLAADVDANPVEWLRAHGALPVVQAYGKGRVTGAERLTPVERMAMALAVGHLNSWESWGHRVREQFASRKQHIDEWEDNYLETHKEAIEQIRSWEAHYSEILELESFWVPGSVYRLRPRELRGWPEIRSWLLEHPNATANERIDQVHAVQAEKGRDFGSERLLKWLAHPDQTQLVHHAAGDVVSRIARYNLLCQIFERTRELPLYTAPDPQLHPRWASFDPPANTNQPAFDLEVTDGRQLRLTIELLVPEQDGLERRRVAFRLAPSGQLRLVGISSDGSTKKPARRVTCRGQDDLDVIEGELGGSTLLFNRARIGRANADGLAGGTVGEVYLGAVVNHREDGRYRSRQRLGAWLLSSLPKRNANPDRVPTDGFAVLAVDLGLRSAAAVSVFRVSRGGGKAPWPCTRVLDGMEVFHERSALLTLPGEDPSPKELQRRQDEEEQLRAVRSSIWLLNQVRRLAVAAEPAQRAQVAASILERDPPHLRREIERLAARTDYPGDRWLTECTSLYRAFERRVGEQVSGWRQLTRPRRTIGVGGKSAGWIEHLERVRRALMAWNRHQAPGVTDVQRLNREKWGTTASRLLEHISHLKDDRVKTTADLIVQAARGRVHGPGGWVQSFEPVDVIIMEDLNRYRFRTDRPKHENRQLMRWAHRQLRALVEQQAQLYGIAVVDAPASYSSRFDAMTRAPGVRCRPLTRAILDGLRKGKAAWLERRLKRLGIDAGRLELGDLLPLGDGELLASCEPGGALRVRHADVNAAQNLGCRVLEGFSVPMKLAATKVGEVFVNAALGARATAAFGGSVVALRPDGDGFVAEVFESIRAASRAIAGDLSTAKNIAEGDSRPAGADDEQLLFESLLEEELEASGIKQNFFRNPWTGLWKPAKSFWPEVETEIITRLRSSGRLHG